MQNPPTHVRERDRNIFFRSGESVEGSRNALNPLLCMRSMGFGFHCYEAKRKVVSITF